MTKENEQREKHYPPKTTSIPSVGQGPYLEYTRDGIIIVDEAGDRITPSQKVEEAPAQKAK